MIFNSSRQFAEDYAEQSIKDVVITVPPFFTMAQRKAILLAAELVGLTVHQLMNDNTAVALNYGVFRRQEFNVTPQYFMFYDMGAISTTATIVEYKLIQSNEQGFAEKVPQLTVKGVGFDRTLGGLEMEMRLRDVLAKRFQSLGKTEGSVYDSPRAMAKLLKEAQRVKQVLSANTDHQAQIEGLLEDVDFSSKVTREELETMCADLFDRVGEPVNQALRSADMTMDEIEQVILFGGGTRVPKVQEVLMNTIKRRDLGKNINTDEAAALGAVYQAAVLSKAFVVKKFLVKEATIYPIEITFERHIIEENGEERTKVVKKTLFQRNNPYPQKKVMTFNRLVNDFNFNISYGSVDFLPEQDRQFLGNQVLRHVSLTGVTDAFDKHKDKTQKGIKAHFRMDESGVLNLDSVEMIFEHEVEEYVEVPAEEESTFSKISSKISSFFGGGSSEEETTPPPPPTQDEESTTEPSSDDQTTTSEPEDTTAKPDTTEEGDTTAAPPPADDEQPTEKDSEGVADDTPATKEPKTVKPVDESAKEEEASKTDDTQAPADESTKAADNKSETDKGKEAETKPENMSTNNTAPSNVTTKKTTKLEVVKEELEVEVVTVDVTPLNTAAVVESKTKLEWLYQRDEEKKLNEQAKNALESHIFEMQDFMYNDEVTEMSTEEERETVTTALSATSDWLYDEGEYAETRSYKQKLRELKKASRPIIKRMAEASARPAAIGSLKEVINMSSYFLTQMKNFSNSSEVESIFTEVEITTLEALLNETKEWFEEMEGKQNATKPFEDPVMFVEDIDQKGRALHRETRYMVSKLMNYAQRPPKPPKYGRYNTSKNATRDNSTISEDDDIDDTATGGYDDERPTSGYDDAPTSEGDEEGPTSTYGDAPPPPTVDNSEDDKSGESSEDQESTKDQGDQESEEILQLDGGPAADEKVGDDHQEL
ncbi:hypoxia up-regulated protein 1-like isoform X2 [Dysidea avara]